MDFIDVPLSGSVDRLSSVDSYGTRTVQFAKHLQRLLLEHDRVVTQIQQIDSFIIRTKNTARRAMTFGHKGRALHYLGISTIAAEVKAMYQQSRAFRWYKVQRLVAHIMRELEPTGTRPADVTFQWEGPGEEGELVMKYSNTMMVSQCNFTRFS